MQEFGTNVDAEVLQNRKRMDQCDVVCLVYDSSDVNSFAYIAGLVEKYKIRHLTLVFISTKNDMDLVAQVFWFDLALFHSARCILSKLETLCAHFYFHQGEYDC